LPRDHAEARQAELVAQIERFCRDNGLPVSWDGFINESTAARLLDRAPGTLRNWRGQHRPLTYRRLRGQVKYSLQNIAWVLIEAENIDDD
jgi:hypothetical protein